MQLCGHRKARYVPLRYRHFHASVFYVCWVSAERVTGTLIMKSCSTHNASAQLALIKTMDFFRYISCRSWCPSHLCTSNQSVMPGLSYTLWHCNAIFMVIFDSSPDLFIWSHDSIDEWFVLYASRSVTVEHVEHGSQLGGRSRKLYNDINHLLIDVIQADATFIQ